MTTPFGGPWGVCLPGASAYLGRLLTSADYRPVCYASAEALLEAASKALPHGCLVVDLRMDGMSGLSLAKTLHKRDADLPVITLTAHDTDQARSEASRGGVTSFLRKPVTDQVLLGAIVSALDRTVATHNGSEPARSGADRPSKQTP